MENLDLSNDPEYQTFLENEKATEDRQAREEWEASESAKAQEEERWRDIEQRC